jgi:flavin reductase (DIM6/NTAB) family NADH-FMN oxidoreductase RutF
MTVSSFTSVSLNPPLVLVCIDRRCGFIADLDRGVDLGINLLREDQQELAVRFASSPELGRFSGVDWHVAETGVPLLDGAVGAFLCRVDEVLEGGDHVIVLAAVHQLLRGAGRPLVWCESGYHCLPARSR